MPAPRKTIEKYGCLWPAGSDALRIEFAVIQRGGKFIQNGKECGLGLFHHYREAQKLLWPTDDHHRWSDLILKTIVEERVTMILGPKDSGKTHCAARYGLTDYFCFPNETLTLVSSTDLRGLELRVWGDLKDLFTRAKEKHDWLPGNALESKHGIFTDTLGKEDSARDIRKGIICIPCIGGNGEWQGIQKFVGLKQKRRRVLGDEMQFLQSQYLTSLEHLDKGDFKFVGLANPIGQGDPADKIAEPVGGWGTEPDSEKTETWRNRWGGVTINLDGRDSPNFDEPKGRYSYLINQEDITRTEKRCGRDSIEFWAQIVGKRKAGLNAHRVLTRQMCLNFGAFEPVIWAGSATTKVYGIDASYGGDRCVAGSAEFGLDVRGRSIISFNPPKIIPIMVNSKEEPEDQIARFVKRDCEDQGIPPGNVFFDSTGRGSLGTSFGRIWNTAVNPVEFGGTPTERPVAQSMFIFDEKTGARRLKKCSEHYSKRVTEYWFSVRYVVESKQARNFPEEAAEEFGMREWYMVKGDKRELETKEETKLRMGCSPDFADQTSIVVEGARRLGFTIDGLVDEASEIEDDSWLRREMEKHRAQMRKRELSYR